MAGFLATVLVLDFYLRGYKVTFVTDHAPLKQIFSYQLQELSPRLFKMRGQLLEYDISVMVVKGKHQWMADALGHFVRSNPIMSYDPLTEIAKESQGMAEFRGFESDQGIHFLGGAEMVARVAI